MRKREADTQPHRAGQDRALPLAAQGHEHDDGARAVPAGVRTAGRAGGPDAYDGGRAWYTAGGHTRAAYYEPLFVDHLLGGILYAAGVDSESVSRVAAAP